MPRNQALATKILTVENAFETTWSGDDQLKTQQGQEKDACQEDELDKPSNI